MQSVKNVIYTFSLLIVFSLIAYAFYRLSDDTSSVAIIYVLYVLVVARLTTGYFCGILASIFGVIGANYLFYPFLQLNFTISGYPLTFFVMLCISLITSTLTTHIKEQARIASEREEAMRTLNDSSKELIKAQDHDKIIKLLLDFAYHFTQSAVVFYENDPADCLPLNTYYVSDKDKHLFNNEKQRKNAHRAFVSQKLIFVEDEHDSHNAKGIYIPITAHSKVWGILGIYNTYENLSAPDTLSFLALLVHQVSLALERQALSDAHQALVVESEKEKTRANLLRAVSHDLRTPLTSMIGASSTYLEGNQELDEADKTRLVSQIYEDANWLLHMVENLLSVTRIHQGPTKVKKTLEPLEEVISESVARVKKRLPDAVIKASVPNEFIMVPMDPTLIEQVIINLLENAVKHSQSTEPILLKAEKFISQPDNKPYIKVQVIDHGVGVSNERLHSIFDGYNLNPNESTDTSKGMGIGLSICKTIITAHDGQISAENLCHGMAFSFTLPLKGDVYIEQ